jgi:hypothetical protein
MATELATKSDVTLVKADIALLRAELHQDLADVKLEISTEISAVKADITLIKADVSLLRAEMQQGFSAIRHEMSTLQSSLLIKLGALIVTLMGLMFVGLRFS